LAAIVIPSAPGFSASGRAMSLPRDDRQKDLFRPALEAIINMSHPLVRLAQQIDWDFLDRRFSAAHRPGPGQPPLPTRLGAGLFILKHTHALSDEAPGQARHHHGRPLHPRPPVQAGAARAQVPAHAAGPRHPRHHPQDRRQA
jgi:IS5 family transposase